MMWPDWIILSIVLGIVLGAMYLVDVILSLFPRGPGGMGR